jgi:hypothetical protein
MDRIMDVQVSKDRNKSRVFHRMGPLPWLAGAMDYRGKVESSGTGLSDYAHLSQSTARPTSPHNCATPWVYANPCVHSVRTTCVCVQDPSHVSWREIFLLCTNNAMTRLASRTFCSHFSYAIPMLLRLSYELQYANISKHEGIHAYAHSCKPNIPLHT